MEYFFCQTCNMRWLSRKEAIQWWKDYFREQKKTFESDVYDGCCPSSLMMTGGKEDVNDFPTGLYTYDDQRKLERDRKRFQYRRDNGLCITCEAQITEKKPWKGKMVLYSNCATCRDYDLKRRRNKT